MSVNSTRGVFLGLLLVSTGLSQTNAPQIEWQQAFGGSATDSPWVIKQTQDNGFVVVGYSASGMTGNKSTPNYGVDDYWILRLDQQGQKVWDQTCGGLNYDWAFDVIETSQGGFIVAGQSLSGESGNKTTPLIGTIGNSDAWIVCLDGDGNELWERTYGGDGDDAAYSILPTPDGGFILSAQSDSPVSGNKTAPSLGGFDYWILKINPDGDVVWDRTYGGSGDDFGNFLRPVPGGGFIVGGTSQSEPDGNKTSPHYGPIGGYDYWILRLDDDGQKIWERSLGGSDHDILVDVRPTKDGGFVVGGRSRSEQDGIKTSPGYGGDDYWLVKLDSEGNPLWDRSYGGDETEFFRSIVQTHDGGFLLSGNSASAVNGTKTSPTHGPEDAWLVRVDSQGNQLWDLTLGGEGYEQSCPLIQSRDGGYVLASESRSPLSGNKTVGSHGEADVWLVKLRPDIVSLQMLLEPIEPVDQPGFHFLLSAPTNTYVLNYSTNLIQWLPFQTNVLMSNSVVITDMESTNSPRRFYRARVANP